MQIEFSKEQYKSLLKLVYCWNYMINWPRLYEDRILDIDNLCSHIYSKAKDFWCEDKVEYLTDDKIFEHSKELQDDQEINNFIDYYDEDKEDDFFWESLIEMLVDRDLKEKFKNPLLNNVWEYVYKLTDSYWEEFSKNWINNLRLDKVKRK